MKEYTIIAATSVVLVLILDFRLNTGLFKKKLFYQFHGLILLVETLVNGYLTWRPIVLYGESFYLGIRIFTIPIEDYVFGFSLLTLNLILYEFFIRKVKPAPKS